MADPVQHAVAAHNAHRWLRNGSEGVGLRFFRLGQQVESRCTGPDGLSAMLIATERFAQTKHHILRASSRQVRPVMANKALGVPVESA
ncbi:hypothetical protein [Novosphingobium sp. SG720]|uniref:hypothetical protein n=1 Tax=Novosphingobium sp. SG720 TaxID=2586998 RepID=UPI001447C5CE|nr:hypothetical protein [Novosphingobium sp. SG720]NKJ41725.1 hypothetical protein [Novosphingobium sp. SG720]